jgi:FG-GAP-like repeat
MTRLWIATAALTSSLVALGMAACSGSDSGNSTSSGPGTSSSGGMGQGGAGGDLFPTGGGGGCSPGQSCDDAGGICAPDGMSCCEETLLCGTGCCGAGDICSFEQCVAPGNICIDATDCAPGEYCEYALGENMGQGGGGGMCQGGVELQNGKCLPKPPECGPNEDPGEPATCLAKCEYIPDPGQFNPVEKFSWGDLAATNNDVMMAPIVTQLDDDNCDMKVDERDIPDIVFFTFEGNDYNNNNGNSAALRAISIVGGQLVEKWTTNLTTDEPGRSIASGDIHPTYDGNEIVVCAENNRVRAYDAQGNAIWTSAILSTSCFMPSLADLDQNGDVEVIVRGAVLDGQTGMIEAAMSNTQNVVVSDVTGDNMLEIVGSSIIYDSNGQVIVDASADLSGVHPAVGDLDNDGVPEIVTVNNSTHTLSVWHVDPNVAGGYLVLRSGIDINGTISPNPCCAINPANAGCNGGGGPPTIADFNGDGFPDVGLAGGIGYAVFDGQKLMDTVNVPNDQTIAWLTQTQDCSSAQTGSSVFDFDGDGSAEVVYADEVTLHIYRGTDGLELFSTCNTSGTLWEYPLVADVDSDGHADIVVASNRYSSLNCAGQKTTGIRIFGDTSGNWVRTRRIWNQHAYHVTNVEESGRIPAVEAQNYLQPGLNNFRQNVQPLGEFSAPDLVVEPFPICAGEYTIGARVRNIGEASVPAGVVVGFYAGDPNNGGTKLGEATTTQTLYSLSSEDVLLVPPMGKPTQQLYAVVDEGMPTHPWVECRTDNNIGGPVSPDCNAPL